MNAGITVLWLPLRLITAVSGKIGSWEWLSFQLVKCLAPYSVCAILRCMGMFSCTPDTVSASYTNCYTGLCNVCTLIYPYLLVLYIHMNVQMPCTCMCV